jgi:hypothetical protein
MRSWWLSPASGADFAPPAGRGAWRRARPTGTVRGRRGGSEVTTNVRTQADGSVRVEFNTGGTTAQDPDLINRLSRS